MLQLEAVVHYVTNQEMLWDLPAYVRSQGSLPLVRQRYDGFRAFLKVIC